MKYKQESNEYAEAIHEAQINVKRAQAKLESHNGEAMSREDAIAFRTLKDIERKLDVLEKNARFLKSSSK